MRNEDTEILLARVERLEELRRRLYRNLWESHEREHLWCFLFGASLVFNVLQIFW